MGKVRFTARELAELVGASVAVAAIYTIALSRMAGLNPPFSLKAFAVLALPWIAGNVFFHELAHALVADALGYEGRFKVNLAMLVVGFAVAFTSGFFFTTPGAVSVKGNPPKKDMALIAFVGPFTDLLIAVLALSFLPAFVADEFVFSWLASGALLSLSLALWNALPLGVTDGTYVLSGMPLLGAAFAVSVAGLYGYAYSTVAETLKTLLTIILT